MPILNFPSAPSLNEQYSFGGKTWYWTGQAWRLVDTGAINGIPIGNVTPSTGVFTSLSATGNVTGTYFIGNGSQLTGINSTGTIIANGTSNVNIATANGNITMGVANVANVVTISTGGISTTGNVTGTNFIGNIIGNISGNITAPGANTEVLFNNNGILGADAGFTYNSATNNLSVTGDITANSFIGDGSQLANVMADRGSDQPNWNAITQMGTYTVNRVSWSGTSGTPLDSQVYVGLLEVKNSTDTALEQIFYPGTVDLTNAKVQWNRNYWSGTWTPWIKIVNDYQVMQGGEF